MKKHITFNIEEEEIEALKRKADAEFRSYSRVISQFIRKYTNGTLDNILWKSDTYTGQCGKDEV